jgi:hypothetical protein
MNRFPRTPTGSAALTVLAWLVLAQLQPSPASAQKATGATTTNVGDCDGDCADPTPTPTPTPSASPSPNPSPTSQASPAPTPTGADSSGGSIGGLARQRFNQMITNRVLGSVLLGVNEQVNCSDCVSAFGSAGSFSAGIHGRKELTPNLSLLAGIAYTQ